MVDLAVEHLRTKGLRQDQHMYRMSYIEFMLAYECQQLKHSQNFYLFLFSDYLFKLLLIGDSGVGKSCLLLRFAVSILRHFRFDNFFFF